MRWAESGTKSRSRAGRSLSYITTSAWPRHSTARKVSRPGLPGPAPTRKTRGFARSAIEASSYQPCRNPPRAPNHADYDEGVKSIGCAVRTEFAAPLVVIWIHLLDSSLAAPRNKRQGE